MYPLSKIILLKGCHFHHGQKKLNGPDIKKLTSFYADMSGFDPGQGS